MNVALGPTTSRRLARALTGAVALALALLGLAGPAGAASRTSYYDTFLLSRATDGALPNGSSTNGVISQDGRIARAVAFQSDASNLVPADADGTTDVFVIERAPGFGPDGSPWTPGRTRLISRGVGGRPADGPSYAPAISGDASSSPGRDSTAPNCVAFV